MQGWNARVSGDGERHVNSSAGIEDIRLPLYSKQGAKATAIVKYESNLNQAVESVPADTTDEQLQRYFSGPISERRGHITTINVYDPQGNERELRLELYKVDDNLWRARVLLEDSSSLSVNVRGSGRTRIRL